MLKNNQIVASITKAKKAIEIEQIQALWSGYGMISRYLLTDSKLKTVIVKNIVFPNQNNHPKGWNTNISHQRKVKSYQVETEWYKSYSKHCNAACKVPLCFGIKQIEKEQIIVEDYKKPKYKMRVISPEINNTDYSVETYEPKALQEEILSNLTNLETYYTSNKEEYFNQLNQNKLIKEAIEIKLSAKECELMAILSVNQNQVVKREVLVKEIWEDRGVFVDRSLDTFISKLRKKFKDDASINIINIHGVGYKLEVN